MGNGLCTVPSPSPERSPKLGLPVAWVCVIVRITTKNLELQNLATIEHENIPRKNQYSSFEISARTSSTRPPALLRLFERPSTFIASMAEKIFCLLEV